MNDMKKHSDEVFFAPYPRTVITRETMAGLKAQVGNNASLKARICIHPDMSSPVHQMLIGLGSRIYVRPHRHVTKDESLQVIEGLARMMIFDESGRITESWPLGDMASGRPFFSRVGPGIYHTLLIQSDVFLFHETIAGPFDREDTVWAPWAPDPRDPDGVSNFMADLKQYQTLQENDKNQVSSWT